MNDSHYRSKWSLIPPKFAGIVAFVCVWLINRQAQFGLELMQQNPRPLIYDVELYARIIAMCVLIAVAAFCGGIVSNLASMGYDAELKKPWRSRRQS